MSFEERPDGGGSLWCFLFGKFLGIWVAEIFGEIFASFERYACGFPLSESVLKIGCLGFVSGKFAQLAAEVGNMWEWI